MPKADIPDMSAEAVAVGAFGPTSWANVFYFDVAASPGDEGEIANDIGTAVKNLYSTLDLGNFSINWVHKYTRVKFKPSAPSVAVKRVVVADNVGTDDSGDQDAQVAYLINWVTGDVRRGGKPRTYIPGVPLSKCADSATIASGTVSSMTGNINAWLDTLGDGSLPNGTICDLCEMSFIDGGTFRDPPVPFDISSGLLNSIVATQRRRVDRLRRL